MTITNFDTLKRMRDEAQAGGRGSKAYFTFCDAMFEGFPELYRIAKGMNMDARLTIARPQILAEIERITKGVIGNQETDVLWVSLYQTFFDAMSELHDLISGEETDLQLKLFQEPQ